MPQFDNFTYFSQLFWALSFFWTFFVITSFYLLPSISIILKIRRKKLINTKKSETSSILNNNYWKVNDCTNIKFNSEMFSYGHNIEVYSLSNILFSKYLEKIKSNFKTLILKKIK